MKKTLISTFSIFVFCCATLNSQPLCNEFLENCEGELANWVQTNLANFTYEQFVSACDPTLLNPGSIDTYRTGSVAIGTTSDTGKRLTVTQGIITNKTKVSYIAYLDPKDFNSAWGDFVFDKDYNLLSLEKVDDFIAKNKHLPGFESGKKIEAEGSFEVAEITLAQQIKIEEGFLHLIELNKRLENLHLQFEALDIERELIETLLLIKTI